MSFQIAVHPIVGIKLLYTCKIHVIIVKSDITLKIKGLGQNIREQPLTPSTWSPLEKKNVIDTHTFTCSCCFVPQTTILLKYKFDTTYKFI